MINLNNDWLRQDIATPSTYYGYSLSPNPQDSQSVWAIRKVTASGSVSNVTWTNGSPKTGSAMTFVSIWANRTASFTQPTAPGLTWSTSNGTNSFGINSASIKVNWSALSGVDFYNISTIDQNGVVYDYSSSPSSTNENAQFTTNVSYAFLGKVGMTYSVTVTSVNVAGSSSSTTTIAT